MAHDRQVPIESAGLTVVRSGATALGGHAVNLRRPALPEPVLPGYVPNGYPTTNHGQLVAATGLGPDWQRRGQSLRRHVGQRTLRKRDAAIPLLRVRAATRRPGGDHRGRRNPAPLHGGRRLLRSQRHRVQLEHECLREEALLLCLKHGEEFVITFIENYLQLAYEEAK